ncbi:hypothetical protein [Natrialba taiwanensis]|uniref:Uncharacterized protein n=1 Tax=Natrialba taiwanensis DSM 12281 TaxID=1230458 RepID=M0A0T7_9EURY|nr:hypothetical protein [Natrialba taiwanensis]ELY91447.1 hypothetical protein C484_10481 [Natrialba taiwanensis DSM 12281]
MSTTDEWTLKKTDELNALGWTLFDIDGVEYPDRPVTVTLVNNGDVTVAEGDNPDGWITIDEDELEDVLQ